MNVVGFTGTRDMCTPRQHSALAEVLFEQSRLSFPMLVHGCCIGADRQAHAIWRRHHGKVRFRPGNQAQHAWALSVMRDFESIFDPQPYLLRNRRIVEDCSLLIACPATAEPVLRSGTWATVRAAERLNRRTVLVLPSGEIKRLPTSAAPGDGPERLHERSVHAAPQPSNSDKLEGGGET